LAKEISPHEDDVVLIGCDWIKKELREKVLIVNALLVDCSIVASLSLSNSNSLSLSLSFSLFL
jgi:hypothetical protein